MKPRGPQSLPFPADPAARARTRRCAYCGKTGGLVPLARSVLDQFGNSFESGYAHPACFRKVRQRPALDAALCSLPRVEGDPINEEIDAARERLNATLGVPAALLRHCDPARDEAVTRTVSPSPEQSGEVVKRLRYRLRDRQTGPPMITYPEIEQAADALESAQAEIARLTTALNNTLTLARMKWGNLDTDANVIFAEADAALKGNCPCP